MAIFQALADRAAAAHRYLVRNDRHRVDVGAVLEGLASADLRDAVRPGPTLGGLLGGCAGLAGGIALDMFFPGLGFPYILGVATTALGYGSGRAVSCLRFSAQHAARVDISHGERRCYPGSKAYMRCHAPSRRIFVGAPRDIQCVFDMLDIIEDMTLRENRRPELSAALRKEMVPHLVDLAEITGRLRVYEADEKTELRANCCDGPSQVEHRFFTRGRQLPVFGLTRQMANDKGEFVRVPLLPLDAAPCTHAQEIADLRARGMIVPDSGLRQVGERGDEAAVTGFHAWLEDKTEDLRHALTPPPRLAREIERRRQALAPAAGRVRLHTGDGAQAFEHVFTRSILDENENPARLVVCTLAAADTYDVDQIHARRRLEEEFSEARAKRQDRAAPSPRALAPPRPQFLLAAMTPPPESAEAAPEAAAKPGPPDGPAATGCAP